jgi:hypothetical protein
MKKGIYVFLAVLTIFAMVMTGCADDSGKTTKPKTVVTLYPTTLTVEVNSGNQIIPTTDPADAVDDLKWTSSNEAVATVTQGGWVIGVSAGMATITATAKDGGNATCAVTVIKAVSNDVTVEGGTLVHNPAKLIEFSYFGSHLGTENSDGSYTFDGTAAQYNGGGAQYNFPTPKAEDTWSLSNYDLVEIFLKTTSGNVDVIVKKLGGNIDLMPYPSGSQYPTLTSTGDGKFSYKAVIVEAGSGIGFQRNRNGPATVKIEKVVFSKGTMQTITFAGGGATISIPPIKIPNGRTVNFGEGTSINYAMPSTPKWSGHTFARWYNTTDSTNFNPSAAITKNITLTAQWTDGDPEAVDMHLNLDPASWGTLPPHPNIASPDTLQTNGWSHPTNYAAASYDATTKVLTLTYDGKNRQRAIIPLSEEQINEIISTDEADVTFRIDADIVIDSTGIQHNAEFRCHLGDPTLGSGWNGSADGSSEDPLSEHLVEVRGIKSRTKNLLGYFMIQAMYKNPATGATNEQSGFAPVTLTIRSISIDIGNTTTP